MRRSGSRQRDDFRVRLDPYFRSVPEHESNDLLRGSDRVLLAERAVLSERIHDLRSRVDVHREILELMEARLATEQRLLREIDELQDKSPQLRLERLDRQLRGRRLQEVAVEVLRRRQGEGAVIHYRDWFALIRAEGFEVAGKDPVNTFLTNLNRADPVEPVGDRSGLYRLERSA